jgi:Uncharacterized protein conserved in archaea
MLNLELVIEYDSEKNAKAVFESTAPDNDSYVRSELDGKIVRFSMKAGSAGTLKNTADDLLACIKLAEETLGLISGADLDSDTFFE